MNVPKAMGIFADTELEDFERLVAFRSLDEAAQGRGTVLRTVFGRIEEQRIWVQAESAMEGRSS